MAKTQVKVAYYKGKIEGAVEEAVREDGHFFVYRTAIKTLERKQRWAQQYKEVVEVSYKNLIDRIGWFLEESHVSGITSSGRRTLQIGAPDGTPVPVKTPYWHRLDKDYIKRGTESTAFWRKPNKESPQTLADYYELVTSKVTANVTSKGTFKKTTSKKTGNHTRYRIDLDFGTLPFPLYPIIGKAFRTGTHTHSMDDLPRVTDTNRESIARIKFPELQRPALRAIAGDLGANMRNRIRTHRLQKK